MDARASCTVLKASCSRMKTAIRDRFILDYPSVGPEHAYLHDIGRVNYVTATDEEAVDAFFKLSRYEGIIPALESSHAIAYAMKWARENRGGAILVNCSGRGDKDVDYVVEHYGYGEDHQFPA